MSTTDGTPRIGARVLLLDPSDRVLLIHAFDPDDPDHHWWEVPGGGLEAGESLVAAAIRELAEETGIQLDEVGPCLWICETWFHYRGRDHHQLNHVYLARVSEIAPHTATRLSAEEELNVIERRWFTADELDRCPDQLFPAALRSLLRDVLVDNVPAKPLALYE